jgi:hypothetical protein
MNRKVLGMAVVLMAVAILVLPMSVAFAAKPDKFESFTFYGGPNFSAGPMITEQRDAGESANHFINWIWIGWKFSWTSTGTQVFATGSYSGYWVMHGYDPNPPPFGTETGINVNGVFTMTVTNWNGEEGYLIIRSVAAQNPSGSSGKLTILDGMIGDMKVHGTGTSENIVPHLAWQYELQLHFTP